MRYTNNTPYSGKFIAVIGYFSQKVPACIITILFAGFALLINTRPFGLTQLKDITGGVGIPDMELFYTPASLSALLDAMGPAGREFYLTRIIPLDMIFPLLYTLFFMVVIYRLMGILGIQQSRWSSLFLIPLLAGSADYTENIGMLTVLFTYPDTTGVVVTLASFFTLLKWICTPVSFLLILSMAARCLVKRLPRSGNQQ